MRKRRAGENGFTLVEVLVAVGLLGLLMTGILTMYVGVREGYRRSMDVRPLYVAGLILTDSIDRDLRSAWQVDLESTTYAGKGDSRPTGYYLKLVLRLVPQKLTGTNPQKFRVGRLTYANASTGFTRTLETYDTTDPGAVVPANATGSGYRKTVWILTKQVSCFQLEDPAGFQADPRLVRYALYMHKDGSAAWNSMPGYQYLVKSHVWLRRGAADGINPATLEW